jgi:hypothetical protein
MAKINYEKAKTKEEAFEIVRAKITPDYIKKWKVTAEVTYDESNHKISASGKGFDLSFQFDESGIDIELKVSFLLKPLQSTIRNSVEEQLKRYV